MSGSKRAMISRALSTNASPSRSRRGRVVSARLCRRGWPKPCRKRRVVPAPDVAEDCGLKFRHDVQGDDLPARRLEEAPGVSAFLKSKITATATTKKTRAFIGPDFFCLGFLTQEKQKALFHLSLEPVMRAAAKLFKARWYKHACIQKSEHTSSRRGLVHLSQIDTPLQSASRLFGLGRLLFTEKSETLQANIVRVEAVT